MLKQLTFVCLFMLLVSTFSYAQIKVEDGTVSNSAVTPNSNAILDLSSMQRGLLFPRLPLESSLSPAPMSKHEMGMMVFNIATKNDLSPGIYYNDGSKWVKVVQDNTGGISYDPVTNIISFIDNTGAIVQIDLAKIIKLNETITSLIKNVKGSYTYTSEDGTITVIDVPGDVISNFKKIINNTQVLEELTQIVNTIGGNVKYDGSNFTYIDGSGSEQTLSLETLVKGYETLTSLKIEVEDMEGEHPGEVIRISKLKYTDENNAESELDVKALVEAGETLTVLSYNGEEHALVYLDEKGVTHMFKMIDLVGDVETLTSLTLDLDAKRLKYTDENGQVNQLNLAPIIQEPWFSTATNMGAVANTDNIYTQGWVGIGYKEPSAAPNEKLRVNGAISTVNSYYADYVFEDYFDGTSKIKFDYQFKTLGEVEDFLKTHRHLPGITPIDALEKTEHGYQFNVSELSIQLLEKTEELYLHMIEQHKLLNMQKTLLKQQDSEILKLKEEGVLLKERLDKLEEFLYKKN